MDNGTTYKLGCFTCMCVQLGGATPDSKFFLLWPFERWSATEFDISDAQKMKILVIEKKEYR